MYFLTKNSQNLLFILLKWTHCLLSFYVKRINIHSEASKYQQDNSRSIGTCLKLTVCCKDIDAWAWYSCSPSYTMITKICHYSSYMLWNNHWNTLSTLIENNEKYMYKIAWNIFDFINYQNIHVLIEYLQLQITEKLQKKKEFASTRHNMLLKFFRKFCSHI